MLSALRRRRRSAIRGDAGVSLLELMVAMTLSTILAAMTLYLFVQVSSSSNATNDRTIGTASARNTIEAWTSYLEVSDGTAVGNSTNRFEYLSANDMLFYADLNNRDFGTTTNAPTMVWLRLDGGGNLVEEQFVSSAVAGTVASVCRVIALSASAGDTSYPNVLFTAKTSTNNGFNAGDLGSAPTSGKGCQPLPQTPASASGQTNQTVTTNLKTVRTVTIAFTIVDTTGKHPLEFESLATLPSLGATT